MYGPELPPPRYHHRELEDPQPQPQPPPNGSKALSLLLRLCTMLLAVVSAVVMAASSECVTQAPRDNTGASAATVVTFTYNRFGAFVFLVGCNITAAILEALVVYLHVSLDVAAVTAAGAAEEKDRLNEEERGINLPAILLTVVDLLVHALLYSATAAAYTAASAYAAQIGACARFAGQVERAKILSLAASIAVILVAAAKDVPLPFNVPPVLG